MGEIPFHSTMIKKVLIIFQNIHIMINKELSEILDALTRESGDSMSPCKELELLGFDPFGNLTSYGDNDDEDDDPDYSEEEIDEEYDYDEADDRYTLLTQILRLYNCRKKYFA